MLDMAMRKGLLIPEQDAFDRRSGFSAQTVEDERPYDQLAGRGREDLDYPQEIDTEKKERDVQGRANFIIRSFDQPVIEDSEEISVKD